MSHHPRGPSTGSARASTARVGPHAPDSSLQSAVRWLDDVAPADSSDPGRYTDRGRSADLGGKAGPLARLAALGLPVPPAFVILPHVFPSGPAKDETDALTIADAAQEQIREAYVELGRRLGLPSPPVAVRSSATAEDLDGASFAGQYDTFLGVRSAEEVLTYAACCWASLWTPHAQAYREAVEARTGAALPPPAMAVLVQSLVQAAAAGVAFTADPISGDRGAVVINAAWGLGQTVVDGEVEADTWHVDRQSRSTLRQTTGHKPTRTGIGPDAVRVPVPDDLQRRPCLTPDHVARVAELALRAEAAIGKPSDVEWAIDGEALWLLQTRPITTGPSGASGPSAPSGTSGATTPADDAPPPAGAAPDAPAGPTGPTPWFPFTWPDEGAAGRHWRQQPGAEPLRPLREDVFLTFRRSFTNSDVIKGNEKVRRAITLLGYGYEAQVPNPASETERLERKATFERPAIALHERGETYLQSVVFPEIDAGNDRLAAVDVFGLPPDALAGHLEAVLRWFERAWTLHWLWGPQGPQERFTKRYAEVTGDERCDGAAELLAQEPNLLIEAIDGLIGLARIAQGHAPLRELLLSAAPAAVLDTLAAVEGGAPFRAALDVLVEQQGLRCGAGFGNENDEMAPSWREDPSLVVQLVQKYVAQDLDALLVARASATARRDRRVAEIQAKIEDPEQRQQFDFWLTAARRAQQGFEDHNYKIDSAATSLLHLAVTGCARCLVQADVLAAEADVWWLYAQEITAALRGLSARGGQSPAAPGVLPAQHPAPPSAATAPAASPATPEQSSLPAWRQLVVARQALQTWRASLAPPPTLGAPPPPDAERPPEETPSGSAPAEKPVPPENVLVTGQTGCAGVATGRVRLANQRALVPDVEPGDVLVASNAGPLWTPIFPTVAAVVLDQGVLFQHAMLTCREYGVPAVFPAQEATKKLREGQRVTVDATNGWVLPAD